MKNIKNTLPLIISLAGMGLAGCTSGSGAGSALNVSGVLSLGVSSQSQKIMAQGPVIQSEESVSAQSVDLTQYKVSCATTSTPVQTATGSVNSDGSFSVNISGAVGQPLSCFLVDSSGNKAADFMISDSSKKDLSGNAQVSSTAAFKSNASLGAITFDPNAGEVTVPASNISTVVQAPTTTSSLFDPTGAWTISSVDFSLPKGTQGPCANNNNCDGPPNGQSIYLKLWKGVSTVDNSDVYGLQVWQGQNSFATCGSKIGLTSAIKTNLGVDFSANGSADSAFTFATSVPNFLDKITNQTGTVNLTNGWEMSTATLQYNMNPSCAPHDITAGNITYVNAWVCGPDNSSMYQASLGGGCSDSSGNPVNLNDWSGLTFGNTTTDSNGIKTQSATGTVSINGTSKTVTCSNKWAVVNSNYAVQPSSSFNWNDLAANQIPSGTACSAIANSGSSEALKIAQLQCYSNYYYNSGMQQANACLPRVDTDWSATTAAAFAVVDSIRPQNLVFFERYNPFPDGTGGSLLTRQERYDGVNVDGNSWINCHVIEVGGLNVKQISSTKLLATYQSSLITTSTTKPACMAKFNGARQTYMFYLTK